MATHPKTAKKTRRGGKLCTRCRKHLTGGTWPLCLYCAPKRGRAPVAVGHPNGPSRGVGAERKPPETRTEAAREALRRAIRPGRAPGPQRHNPVAFAVEALVADLASRGVTLLDVKVGPDGKVARVTYQRTEVL